MIYVAANGAVSGLTAVVIALTMNPSRPEIIFAVCGISAVAAATFSLVPGLCFYVAYIALLQTQQPKWEYDEAGNFILLIGSVGPSVFLVVCTFAYFTHRTAPTEPGLAARLVVISAVASVAMLLSFNHWELF